MADRRSARGRRRCSVAGLVAVLAVFVLAGCGGGGRSSGPGPGVTTSTTVAAVLGRGLPLPDPGFVPASASFPTAERGYAWGIAPCPRDRKLFCPGLAGTTDAGASWHALAAPTGLPTDPYRRAILRFDGSADGWAANGGLQATHDAAASWHPVALPGLRSPQIAALETAATSVYVVARDGASADAPLLLFRSSVYADEFRAVPGVRITAPGATVSLAVGADGSGWLAAVGVAGTAVLYAADASANWQPARVPCPDAGAVHVAVGIDHQLTVVCDGQTAATGALKTVWRRGAGAPDLAEVGPAPTTGYTSELVQIPQSLRTLAPSEPSGSSAATPTGSTAPGSTPSGPRAAALVLAASGHGDQLLLSLTDGQSWTVAFASTGDGGGAPLGLADLQFPDASHGVVVLGDAGLYARDRAAGRHVVPGPRLLTTADGGRHWAQTVITE